jgi:hypothetical protein
MSIESTIERVGAIRQALADPSTMIGPNAALTGGTEAPSTEGGSTAGEETSFAAALAQANDGLAQAADGSQSFAALPTATSSGLGGAYGGTSSVGPYGPSSGLGAYAPANGVGAYSPTSGVGAYGSSSGVGPYGPAGITGTSGLDYPSRLQAVDGVVGSSPTASTEGLGGRIVAIAETQLGQTERPPGSNESPAIAQYRGATEGASPGAPWCAYFASWVARQAGEPLGQQGQGLGSVSEVWSWAQSTGRAVPNGPGVVPKPGDLIVFGDEHVGIVRGVMPNGQIETIEGNYENKVAANVRSPTEATGYVSMS